MAMLFLRLLLHCCNCYHAAAYTTLRNCPRSAAALLPPWRTGRGRARACEASGAKGAGAGETHLM
eukprot:8970524-Pyramimonas_sp.AAC.1